ncbi:MAG: tRNA-specific adenosine deaminase [Acidocella sp. 20-57-95]|nr:MAG: tRNA-specific adenosine deaminase [Acidocella sp. 20-57-95]OYV62232.1 MAG: tRNA-specific adenosine deaminase [Acidocella sp. 21-58-7]
MEIALREAKDAAARGEVPVGAVVTDAAGNVLAVAGNEVEAGGDASAHAEMLALRRAAKALGTKYMLDCTLSVTLEPCAMCAGAIAAFRVKRLVFGAYDAKSGAVEHGARVFMQATTHHKPEVIGGVEEVAAGEMLRAFFEGRRG